MVSVPHTELFSTYSIVAHDANTGQLGVAVQTHQVGVGRVVPWLKPGLGAVATQSLVNISFGPLALAMLAEKISPEKIVASLIASDTNAHRRQVALINAAGEVAAHTGTGCIREAGHMIGEGYSVQANMMTRDTVIAAMANAFEKSKGDLAGRMLAALKAAQAEDGDIRGMQSAALKVVPGDPGALEWATIYDLRVDEHEAPVEELARLVRIRKAQRIDEEGHRLLNEGKTDKALKQWKLARDKAPEIEELAFWQAVALADIKPSNGAVSIAGRILQQALEDNDRREHWVELIRRLQETGIIERENAGEELITALEEA